MAKSTVRRPARSTHRGPHAGPLTREQGRQFRTGVIEALRAMHDHKFHGTVRAFARQLLDQHGSQQPFDALGRVEGRLRRLERENVIRYDWGKSQAYEVVTTITLVDSEAVEPPQRRLVRRREITSPMEQQRRRMELLAALDHLGGNAESVRALAQIVLREYGDRHRSGTVVTDAQSLERSRFVEKSNGRVHGRPTQRISITSNGRSALVRYRDGHNGEPKPPAPTDIGEATAPAAAPKGRPRVELSDLSRTILGEFARRHSSSEATPVSEIIGELWHIQGFAASLDRKNYAQTVRFRCRDLSSSGYLERIELGMYRITAAGLKKIDTASAPPPPAPPTVPPSVTAQPAAPSTPPASTTAAALAQPNGAPSDGTIGTEPSGPLPEAVRAIDGDIGRANAEIQRLAERRASLEREIEDLDHRDLRIAQQRGRLEQLRKATLETYASDPPTTASNDDPSRT